MKKTLSKTLFALCSAALAWEAVAEESIVEELVTVVGTKSERALKEVGATVSLIDREAIERQVARDIADLVRYEPGVTVAGTGNRFGLSGFNIRGIEGNRVLMIVDGIRVADEFSFGPFLGARRDYVDVDSLELVEIARGPISSLYGSDALGGVVSMTTRGPKSFLTDGDTFSGEVKGGYSSDDSSVVGTLNLAAGNERLAGLLSFTQRDSEETENMGASGGVAAASEVPDPQEVDVQNLTLKLALALAENHDLMFSYEDFQSENDLKVLSDYGLLLVGRGAPTLIQARDAFDERDRSRLSLTYEYVAGGLIESALIRAYTQESTTSQITQETRIPGVVGSPLSRIRSSEFEQEIDGFYVHLISSFQLDGVSNSVTYGAETFETHSESVRNGSTADASGVPQREFTNFPTRDFPITSVRQTALFLQNESLLLEDDLRVTLGLRYDDFEADVQGDETYFAGNPGSPIPADFEDSEVTFAASAVYNFSQAFSAFARFSEGFRAPPYDDVNVGFTNPLGGYKTISNPDLKSETSQGFELGLRWGDERLNASFAIYQNDYENFIESLAIAPSFLASGGIDPADGYLTFQSVNRTEVEIEGAEITAQLALDQITDALTGFSLRLAAAFASGEDTVANEPLNTINPITLITGVDYLSERWGAQLTLTAVEAKDNADISDSRLATSGYGVLDLTGYYDFSDAVSVNVGLFNITDKRYIRWADTVSIGGDASARFTQPGFNAGASVRVIF